MGLSALWLKTLQPEVFCGKGPESARSRFLWSLLASMVQNDVITPNTRENPSALGGPFQRMASCRGNAGLVVSTISEKRCKALLCLGRDHF